MSSERVESAEIPLYPRPARMPPDANGKHKYSQYHDELMQIILIFSSARRAVHVRSDTTQILGLFCCRHAMWKQVCAPVSSTEMPAIIFLTKNTLNLI